MKIREVISAFKFFFRPFDDSYGWCIKDSDEIKKYMMLAALAPYVDSNVIDIKNNRYEFKLDSISKYKFEGIWSINKTVKVCGSEILMCNKVIVRRMFKRLILFVSGDTITFTWNLNE